MIGCLVWFVFRFVLFRLCCLVGLLVLIGDLCCRLACGLWLFGLWQLLILFVVLLDVFVYCDCLLRFGFVLVFDVW